MARAVGVSRMLDFRVLTGLALALLIYAPSLAGDLYSTSNSGHKVNILDPNSGKASEFASFDDLISRGIAFESSGKLYVTANFDDHSTLEELDRTTGARIHIGQFEENTFVEAIDFDYQGSFFALSTDGKLFRLDREVGSEFKKKKDSDILDMTLVGETGVTGSTDIAIDLLGRLFAVSDDELYQVDPLNSDVLAQTKIVIRTPEEEVIPPPAVEDEGTVEVSFQAEGNVFAGLMFDEAGTLFATSNSCPASLYQVDPDSGSATFVSATDMCDPCSGDFPPPEFVAAGIGGFWDTGSGGVPYMGFGGSGISGGVGGYAGGGGIGAAGGGGSNGSTGSNTPPGTNGPDGGPNGPDGGPGVTPVPEPGTLSIFGIGVLGLGLARKFGRRRRAD